jgi:RimJ/RimL family protein N-acetyltransferase
MNGPRLNVAAESRQGAARRPQCDRFQSHAAVTQRASDPHKPEESPVPSPRHPSVVTPLRSSSMEHVTVRPIAPSDGDGYLAVFETVAAEGRWIGTEAPIPDDRKARLRAAVEQPSDQSYTLVAVASERVVGFAHVEVERGRSYLGMALLPGYRGRGLGKSLLDGCVEWSRRAGAHKVDLEVWPHNTAARRLYEGAGFVIEGHRRRHHRRNSGELWDSIEMSLILDEESPGSPHSADLGGSQLAK